jgi:hypothetical protein
MFNYKKGTVSVATAKISKCGSSSSGSSGRCSSREESASSDSKYYQQLQMALTGLVINS